MKTVLLYISTILLMLQLVNCGKPQNNTNSNYSLPDSVINAPLAENVLIDLDSSKIGHKIHLKGRIGKVDRKNKHCMLFSGTTSIRLDARGDITGFNKELVGCDVSVYGLLRERRFYIDELNSLRIKVEAVDPSKIDTLCERQMHDLDYITLMQEWIKENNRPYYSILSLDCEDYTIL